MAPPVVGGFSGWDASTMCALTGGWRVLLERWFGEGVGNVGIFASGGGICYPCTLSGTVGPHGAAFLIGLALDSSLDFVDLILAGRESAAILVKD